MDFYSTRRHELLINIMTWINFQVFYAKRKTANSKVYTLCDPICMTFWKRQKHKEKNNISIFQVLEGERKG
jgi:hypothetical protein